MKTEQMVKYPDFLADFKEIASLAAWQKSVISRYCYDGAGVLDYIKMVLMSDYYDFLKKRYGILNADNVITLHRRYAVTTLEVLKEYIGVWLLPANSAIEYDRETNTMKIRMHINEDNTVTRALTRNVLPCNMKLEFEVVED